jgi:thiol-disulfide isomerase/thioredoxin
LPEQTGENDKINLRIAGEKQMTRLLKITAALVLAAMALVSCGGESESSSDASSATAQATSQQQNAGSTAAQAAAQAATIIAQDIDGASHEFSQWIGNQPTVVNVWGTWCPPCRREVPDLVRLYNEYGPKGVEMLGVAVNDTPEKVRSFASQHNMAWPMFIGTREMARPLQLSGSVPTTIFYDKNSREVERFVGMRDYATFKRAFEKISES